MNDQDLKAGIMEIHGAVAKLSEHFDAVQIFATGLKTDGSTAFVELGSGNWFARQGLAMGFINKDVADQNANAIAEIESREEGEDE